MGRDRWWGLSGTQTGAGTGIEHQRSMTRPGVRLNQGTGGLALPHGCELVGSVLECDRYQGKHKCREPLHFECSAFRKQETRLSTVSSNLIRGTLLPSIEPTQFKRERSDLHQDSTGDMTLGDMAQARDEHLLAPLIQGLFIKRWDLNIFRALCIDLLFFPRFLLSCFFSIGFGIKCGEVLTGSPSDEVIAVLVSIVVTLISFAQRMEGSNHMAPTDLVRGCIQSATNKQLLLMLCSFGLMINSAHAENQTESRKLVAPNIWETRDYAKAAAVTLLAGLMTIGGAGVSRRMINRRRLVPEIPLIPAQLPAVPIIPVQLPIIPAVPGVPGDTIDDVLARAPVATRLNSPLPWLM